MLPKFLTLVITPSDFIKDEAEAISMLLQGGIDYVHIRKPQASEQALRDLIMAIPKKFRHRLKLHDCYELCEELGLGGFQINSRNPIPERVIAKPSFSCHSFSELDSLPPYKYATLSPVFDSISKPGYQSNFSPDELIRVRKYRNIIAMGGIVPPHFPLLQGIGFAGAALSGYIWTGCKEAGFLQLLSERINEISRVISDLPQKTSGG